MPEFLNPFSGVVPGRKLTDSELARAIRLNIAAEHEAVHLYESHADATDNPLAATVLRDIAREERVHAGEFQRLLNLLLPDEAVAMAEGAGEVDEIAEAVEKAGRALSPQEIEGEDQAPPSPPSVGDLKQ